MPKPTYEELQKRIELLEKEQKIRKEIDDLSDAELKNDIQRLDYLSRVAQRQGEISDYRRREAELFEKVQKLREQGLIEIDKTLEGSEREAAIAEQLAETLGITIERLKEIEENGKKASDELERFSGILSEGEELGDAFFGSIAAHLGIAQSRLGSFINKIGELDPKGIEEFQKQFSKYFNAMNIGMSILTKFFEMTLKFALAVDKASSAFAANTGAGRAMQDQIGAVGNEFRRFGITAEEAGKAAEALFSQFPGFLNQNEAVQESMMKTVAGLDLLGVSADDSIDTIMFLNKNLGMTADRATDVAKNIAMSGKALGMTASDITKQFNKSLKVLAVYGDKSLTIFKNLAAQAKAAGVELDSLLGLAGKFDTFSDAAETTGKLNALLGSQLSTTELLMMTEDERIETLIRTIQASGRSFKELGRFEQKAIAAAAGIDDLNEAQRIFGMSLGQYRQNAAEVALAAEKQKEFEERMKGAMDVAKQFKMLMADLALPLGNLIEPLRTVAEVLLEFMSMGGGLFAKLTILGLGFGLVFKALWPLKGLLTFFTAVGLPGFSGALGAASKTLAGATPTLGAAGAGLGTFGAGLATILGPVALVVGAFALLAFAIGYMFSSMTEGLGRVAELSASMSVLATVLGTIGTVGLLSSLGFGRVVSGLRDIKDEVLAMPYDKLQATADILNALTGKGANVEGLSLEAGIQKTHTFINDLEEKPNVKPMLENLALISTGTSAETMNQPKGFFDMIGQSNGGIISAIKSLKEELSVNVTLNAEETKRFLAEGQFKREAGQK